MWVHPCPRACLDRYNPYGGNGPLNNAVERFVQVALPAALETRVVQSPVAKPEAGEVPEGASTPARNVGRHLGWPS